MLSMSSQRLPMIAARRKHNASVVFKQQPIIWRQSHSLILPQRTYHGNEPHWFCNFADRRGH